jgi:hypothetical protein
LPTVVGGVYARSHATGYDGLGEVVTLWRPLGRARFTIVGTMGRELVLSS